MGAVMLIPDINDLNLENVFCGAGSELDTSIARSCANSLLVEFTHALSAAVLKNKDSRQFPDVVTFGYFCRKANIKLVLQAMQNPARRRGWGIVVHVAPSNIPVNFAFSFLMGFLTGNVNYVRVPSVAAPQIDIIVTAIDTLLNQPSFAGLAKRVKFFRCERDSPALMNLVKSCDGLVVWGGDKTVAKFQAQQKKTNVVELYFPDRASSLLIDADALFACDSDELATLSHDFFNDTFLVDQNACSSPNVVYWLGNQDSIEKAQTKFWSRIDVLLQGKVLPQATMAIEKRLDLLQMTQSLERSVIVKKFSENIWLFEDKDLIGERLRFGNFLQICLQDISELAQYIRPNEQTLTYFGVRPMQVYETLLSHGCNLDRIVPVGQALAISMHWDGKNVLNMLSHEIEIA